jgi:hypothetical protein
MKQPPLHLHEITLSQWVDFWHKYGQSLDRRFRALQQLPQGSEQRAQAYLLYDLDNTIQQYAHYTDTPLDEVMKYELKDLCTLQGKSFISLKQEEVTLNIHQVFDWNGYGWQIKPIFDKPTNQLTRQQFEHSQDIALIYSDCQDGKREAIYELCAAFMRKVNEPFSSELVDQSGERVRLMQSLPMNMATAVRLYTEQSINLWLKLKGD